MPAAAGGSRTSAVIFWPTVNVTAFEPIAVSLGAIVVILGVTTIASLWKSKRDAKAMVAGSDSTTD